MVPYCTFIFLLSSLVILPIKADQVRRDVCVIGGGAAGMSAAVFLKDRGYNVLVLEIAPQVGGHCNTIRTSSQALVSPVTGDLLYPGYVDVGVVVYQDTKLANDSGKGLWSLNSKQFVERFVSTTPLDFSSSSSATIDIDFKLGISVAAPTRTPEEQQAYDASISAAIGRIYAVTLQYPWLNTGKRPDPLPAFMLEVFTNFIRNYSLEVLIKPIFLGLLTGGGMGSLDRLLTYEALQVLAPITLDLFSIPNSGFSVPGGCQLLYDRMAQYLGVENVLLNSKIRLVSRRRSDGVTISGLQSSKGFTRFEKGRPLDDEDDDDDDGERSVQFSYVCDKIIVGIYPLLSNLKKTFDLSPEESTLFSQFEANYYMAIAVNVSSGSLSNSPFTIYNVDINNPPSFQSQLPSLSTLTRNFPAGPVAAYVNSDSEVPLTYNQALKLATDGFAKIPSTLLSGFNVVEVNYHLYNPHFKRQALASRPSADTRFANLQGKQNTYWVGAATRYDASSVVWNQAYELINSNFPVK